LQAIALQAVANGCMASHGGLQAIAHDGIASHCGYRKLLHFKLPQTIANCCIASYCTPLH